MTCQISAVLKLEPVLKVILGESKILVLCRRLNSKFPVAHKNPLGALGGFHPGQDYIHCSGLGKALGLF